MLNNVRKKLHFNQIERDEWVREQAVAIPAGSRVLDVGAGRAPYRNLFSHCAYFTQDFGQEPTTKGQYAKLNYECDILAIPVEDESFDVILCTEVLEHVPEPIKVIGEFHRILRPGGRLLLTAPLGCRLHQEPYHFYGGFTPHWYRKFLEEAGFKIAKLDPNRRFFSLFMQEASYFNSLIRPGKKGGRPIIRFFFWLATFPICKIMLPLLSEELDELDLETANTWLSCPGSEELMDYC